MKIRYRRTGGVANIKMQMEFDSESLPPKNVATLEKLFRIKSTEEPAHPDDFVHELEILDDPKHKKMRFSDSRLTSEAVELFDYLTQRRKVAKEK
jgi:Emfourin